MKIKLWILSALLFGVACLLPSIAESQLISVPTPTVANVPYLPLALQARGRGTPMTVIARNHGGSSGAGSNVGVDSGCTSRTIYTTAGPVTNIRLLLYNGGPSSSSESEGAGFNSIIQRASIEYPLGTATSQACVNGNSTWVNDFAGSGVYTDNIGVFIPANTQFAVRLYDRVSTPPTSPSVSLASGGSLSTSSTYYYWITGTDTGIQSGPTTTTVSVTPTSGNQSATLTWVRNPKSTVYSIYRSTTNTATSSTLLATVNDPTQAYTDTGAITPVSGVNPPTSPQFEFNCILNVGDSTNAQYGGGNGLDATNTVGALSIPYYAGAQQYSIAPLLVLGDDPSHISIFGCGDSIEMGVGIYNATELMNGIIGNFFEVGDNVAGFSSKNLSLGGATIKQFIDQSQVGIRLRMSISGYSNYFITDLGSNDIAASGQTWTQTATNHLLLAQSMYNRGVRYVLSTVAPRPIAVSNCLTIASQSLPSFESQRENYNTWVRNGCQVSGNIPVLTGGSPSPYIFSYFDMAAPIEANSSNVLTANGGYWQVPTNATLSNLATTGTPTATLIPYSAGAWAINQWTGYVLKMTSGAAIGQVAVVNSNTANTLTLYANGASSPTGVGTLTGLTTVPSAGDTFSLYAVNTFEGTHPSTVGHSVIGSAFGTFLQTLTPSVAP